MTLTSKVGNDQVWDCVAVQIGCGDAHPTVGVVSARCLARVNEHEAGCGARHGLVQIQPIGLGVVCYVKVEIAVASDPFFGRGGRLLSANQIADEAKLEILSPITSEEEPTAIASFNYHADKFSRIFEIRTSKGDFAETACIGFGLERIALALLKTHGLDLESWPELVRETLKL